MSRKLLKNIDTKQKVYGMIPLKNFLIFVLPFSGTLIITNLLSMISDNLKPWFLILSVLLISINLFLFSEIRFGQTGLRLILDIIFGSKIEHYDNEGE